MFFEIRSYLHLDKFRISLYNTDEYIHLMTKITVCLIIAQKLLSTILLLLSKSEILFFMLIKGIHKLFFTRFLYLFYKQTFRPFHHLPVQLSAKAQILSCMLAFDLMSFKKRTNKNVLYQGLFLFMKSKKKTKGENVMNYFFFFSSNNTSKMVPLKFVCFFYS